LISFFLQGSLLEGKSISLLNFLLLFRCVFEAMLKVKVNIGFHKLFCIKCMFLSYGGQEKLKGGLISLS
jgi:hypothetical protein